MVLNNLLGCGGDFVSVSLDTYSISSYSSFLLFIKACWKLLGLYGGGKFGQFVSVGKSFGVSKPLVAMRVLHGVHRIYVPKS